MLRPVLGLTAYRRESSLAAVHVAQPATKFPVLPLEDVETIVIASDLMVERLDGEHLTPQPPQFSGSLTVHAQAAPQQSG